MYAHGIHVLYEADRDHIVILITDHLQLQLLPAGYALLDQHLVHQGCLQTTCAHYLELLFVVYESSSGTAHRICRSQHHRIPQLIGYLQCLVYGICHL